MGADMVEGDGPGSRCRLVPLRNPQAKRLRLDRAMPAKARWRDRALEGLGIYSVGVGVDHRLLLVFVTLNHMAVLPMQGPVDAIGL